MEKDKQVRRLQQELDQRGFMNQEQSLLRGIESGSPFFELEVIKDFKLKTGTGTDYVQYMLNFCAVQPNDYQLVGMDVTVMRSFPNKLTNSIGFIKATQSFPLYKEALPTAEAAYHHTSGLLDNNSSKEQKQKPHQENGRQIKSGSMKRWWRRGKRP